jgi:chromosome partitioning protein
MPDASVTVNRGPKTVDDQPITVIDGRVPITVDGMAKQTERYVVAAEKGGGGKTTLAASLAGALAEGSTRGRRGPARRVLVIDLDPQAAITAALGVIVSGPSVYDVLVGGAEARAAIVKSLTPGIDVLPAVEDLAGGALELPRRPNWQTSLRGVLDQVQGYDDIVIDTAPGLGVLPMIGLVAGRRVLVPLPPAFGSLRLVDRLLATVERARTFNPGLAVLGLVPWMVGRRTLHRDEALAEMQKRWPDLVLTRSKDGLEGIPERVAFQDAAVEGLPITAYMPTSPAADAVRDLTKEIIARATTT